MSRLSKSSGFFCSAWLVAACASNQGAVEAPSIATAPSKPSVDPFISQPQAAEASPPPRPKDEVTIGTFNLAWAFDEIDDRTDMANEQNADSEDSWNWKIDNIASLLAEAELDIVAIQSIGGERELFDLVVKIREHGGPNYNTAYVDSEDRLTGLQMAILSKHLVMDESRLDVKVPRHVVAEINLPEGESLTVINVHLRGGHYKMQRDLRAKEADKIKRKAVQIAKSNPVVVLGDMTGDTRPDQDGYRETSAGIFAGATTRTEEDDCADSARFDEASETDSEDKPHDRIIACGIDMVNADVYGRERIFRDERDPEGSKWFEVPVESSPYRDLSDHLLVRSTLKLRTEAPVEDSPDSETE